VNFLTNGINTGSAWLLVATVLIVGVLHTVVPDHWVPIVLIARQRGWSKIETARAALQAGTGHVVTTLILALVVWVAGVAVAAQFGHLIDSISSIALVGFGLWFAVISWREIHSAEGHGHGQSHGHGHSHSHDFSHLDHEHSGHTHEHGTHTHGDAGVEVDKLYAPMKLRDQVATTHIHAHKHGDASPAHRHWHDHSEASNHSLSPTLEAAPPLHKHAHKTTARTALFLILGSSPMVEGIPAFFAAGKFGVGLIVLMAIVFGLSTIVTYVLLCVYSTAGLQRVKLGSIERYGEVLSGAFIALVGVAFWLFPIL